MVDYANDPRHKGFIRVILHVPAERGELLTKVLGWPTYTNPVPVALARLEIGAFHSAPVDGDATATPQPPVASASGESRPSHSFAQDAAIKCTKPHFRLFLEKTFLPRDNKCNDADGAAEIVRYLCDVKSRAEIIEGTAAADKWERLLWRYTNWEAGLE